ncbi:MAG: C40 family peptidase [Armatimonadetes bacterium]|nr:C40 family peptidase [Armatimonadota bacterium]
MPPFALSEVRASTEIRDISLKNRDNRWEISVTASRSVPFSGRKLSEGNRFYVDFPDCRLALGQPVLTLAERGVTVRAAQFSIDPAIVRVVIQSTEGYTATLATPAPSHRAVITLPAVERFASQTRIEFTSLPRTAARPPLNRSAPRRPARSALASRNGRTQRVDMSQFVFPPDAMEAFDDPPVPSVGGSLEGVVDADLPDPLKQGTRVALAGSRKYVWGGESPNGFDCSGMVQFIYRYAGVQLPRTAAEQYKAGAPVDQSELEPGDLVFFSNGKRIFHVGIYIGNGRMFHAANPRRGLTTDLLSSSFYSNHYAGARRPLRQG